MAGAARRHEAGRDAPSDDLVRVAEWVKGKPKPTIIWDGSPVHRARLAQDKAKETGLEIIPLPGYSPDLNPIEGLWKRMRWELDPEEEKLRLSS